MNSVLGTSERMTEREQLAILIPVFNDWQSLSILLPRIDTVLSNNEMEATVIVIDDGSTLPLDESILPELGVHTSLAAVELLKLRCNLGHQRAIAVGFDHLNRNHPKVHEVVVMDGDGEDNPCDIPALVSQLREDNSFGVVFAARTRRFESLLFQAMYHLYRFLHWLLTGVPVRFGNFSALKTAVLPRLLVNPNLWNHYAAATVHSRIPFSTLPIPRGRRYLGKSHMAFSGLVYHGLSAIAVFSGTVGARLAIANGILIVIVVSALAIVVAVRLWTPFAIPGWATNAAGFLVVILLQSIMSILFLMLLVLSNRSQAKMIPARDASLFVESAEQLRKSQ